jgi:hypothetical protein
MRAIVAGIMCREIGKLDMHYPAPGDGHAALVRDAIRRLESEG